MGVDTYENSKNVEAVFWALVTPLQLIIGWRFYVGA
jgi:hypothetical protein